MKNPLFSIIIVNHDTGHFLYRCLDSIKKSIKNIEYEVIIVDNNSSDNSWQAANKFPEYTLIRNKKNVGFCQANNQVLKMIKSEYALLLNPDTELTGGAIEKMLKFIQSHPEVGIIGPKVLYPDGRLQYTAFFFPTLFTVLTGIFFLNRLFPKSRLINKKCLRNYHDIQEVDTVSGCCLLLRKRVYDEIGGLDLLFWDDIDFCKRAKDKDWKVVYFPEGIIYHFGGGSSIKTRYVPVYFSRISRIKYFRKYHGLLAGFLVTFITLSEVILRMPIESVWYVIEREQTNRTRLKAYFEIIKFILSSKYQMKIR